MKILLISKTGSGTGILYKLYKEGHEIKAFIKNLNARRKLKGIIPKVSSISEGMISDPDMIVFDSCGLGSMADKLKSEGKQVWGGSLLADKLFLDDEFCKKKLEQCGFNVKSVNTETVTVGCIYDNGKRLDPNVTFITTDTFYPMGFGQKVEGMSTFGWINGPSLLDQEVERLSEYVDKHKYSGVIYFRFGRDESGAICLTDIDPQMVPHLSNVHYQLLPFLTTLGKGEKLAGSLRVAIPPYPFNDFRYLEFVYDRYKSRPVDGITSNFYPNDLMFLGDGWSTAGSDGIIGDIVVSGRNLKDIFSQVADTFDKIKVEEKTARIDFIDHFNEKFGLLEGLGFNVTEFLSGYALPRRAESKDKELYSLYIQALKRGDNKKIIEITRTLRENGRSLAEFASAV